MKKIAVIGAGVMGAGIAAHIANAGVKVVLLDIVPPDIGSKGAQNRNAIADGAVQKMLKASPAPFMRQRNAKLITTGNTEDHLALLADCDWIIEAVIEKLDVKRALYQKIEAARKDGSIVSSNTSTMPLAVLTKGMGERFASDFLITHFFNPPRYMRLLELVAGAKTRIQAIESVRAFCDAALGKGVVVCKDSPGFIGNRIGTYWLQCAYINAIDQGLSVEEADLIMGKPLGFPKTGVFALLDLVGLDLMPLILNSMAKALPKDDAFQEIYREPSLIHAMVKDGYLGRKGKGGFYRLDASPEGKVKQARNLKTGVYAAAAKPRLNSVLAAKKGGPQALAGDADRGGRYAWSVLSKTLSYAAEIAPRIADDIVAIDAAMRLGYNWKYGPFELLDKLGPTWFSAKLKVSGLPVPKLLEMAGERTFYRVHDGKLQCLSFGGGYVNVVRAKGSLLLSDVKLASSPLASNYSASLWDIGDKAACLEFHSKMNALDPFTLSMIERALDILPRRGFKALVIHNEAENFSVGANIMMLQAGAMLRLWPFIRWVLKRGQRVLKAMKFAPFPVVGAPSGLALGGGLEVLLHCDAIQAHSETYAGLVEAGVGIIPGWGGCKEMLIRHGKDKDNPRGPMPPVMKTFETIAMAMVSKSADEARDLKFLRPGDGVTMNRDRLLFDAKQKALKLAQGYVPPVPELLSLPGATGRAGLELAVQGFIKKGIATPHDAVIAKELARALSGGDADFTEPVGEDHVLALERDAIVNLAHTKATRSRIAHMLKTGKPLRN